MPVTVMNQGNVSTAANQAQTNALLTTVAETNTDESTSLQDLGTKLDEIIEQLNTLIGIITK